LKIEVVAALDLHPSDIDRWSSLQAGQPRLDSPFLSPRWTQAVARAREATGKRASDIKVAILRADDGQAIGFLPARVRADVGMPVGAPMCDYQALVSAPGVAMDPRQLLTALRVHRLDFCHMQADDETLARHGRGQADSWIVEAPDGYAAYEAGRRAAGSGVLKDIDKEVKAVEEASGYAREAGIALDEILSQVEQVSVMVQQIATASEQQSTAATQISRDIEAVAEVANGRADDVNHIAEAAVDLAKLSARLKDMISMFKLEQGGGQEASTEDEPPAVDEKKRQGKLKRKLALVR